ncbi:MAG: tetratricopeptide repeat protein [Planctomycetota bacterium]
MHNFDEIFVHALEKLNNNHVLEAKVGFTTIIDAANISPIDILAASLVFRSNCNVRLGDHEAATADLIHIIKRMPDAPVEHRAQAFYNLGVTRMELGDKADANNNFTFIIEKMPDAPFEYLVRALLNRGWLREEVGDNHGAIEDYTKIIEELPNAPVEHRCKASFNRGWLREEIGDKHGAIEDYTKIIEKIPHGPAKYRAGASLRLGMLHFENGDYCRANDEYSRIIEKTPGASDSHLAEALLYRGAICKETGNLTGATADFTHVVEQLASAPSNLILEALYARGATYAETGRFSMAQKDAARLTTLRELETTTVEGVAAHLEAVIHFYSGNAADGFLAGKRGLGFLPTRAGLHWLMAFYSLPPHPRRNGATAHLMATCIFGGLREKKLVLRKLVDCQLDLPLLLVRLTEEIGPVSGLVVGDGWQRQILRDGIKVRQRLQGIRQNRVKGLFGWEAQMVAAALQVYFGGALDTVNIIDQLDSAQAGQPAHESPMLHYYTVLARQRCLLSDSEDHEYAIEVARNAIAGKLLGNELEQRVNSYYAGQIFFAEGMHDEAEKAFSKCHGPNGKGYLPAYYMQMACSHDKNQQLVRLWQIMELEKRALKSGGSGFIVKPKFTESRLGVVKFLRYLEIDSASVFTALDLLAEIEQKFDDGKKLSKTEDDIKRLMSHVFSPDELIGLTDKESIRDRRRFFDKWSETVSVWELENQSADLNLLRLTLAQGRFTKATFSTQEFNPSTEEFVMSERNFVSRLGTAIYESPIRSSVHEVESLIRFTHAKQFVSSDHALKLYYYLLAKAKHENRLNWSGPGKMVEVVTGGTIAGLTSTVPGVEWWIAVLASSTPHVLSKAASWLAEFDTRNSTFPSFADFSDHYYQYLKADSSLREAHE